MNMINHANIYLKKHSAEYARIILSTWHKVTEFTEQLPRQTYSECCQTFKIKHFAKRIMLECRCATRNFSGQEEEFVELGHFDKHFIKNINRKPKSGNFFLPSCVPVSVAEYASVSLNMTKYP